MVMTCQLCGTPCDGTTCPTCDSLAAGADFAALVTNPPNKFDARLEAKR